VLSDNSTKPGTTKSISLTIRPEELTRTDISRLTVQQTLGGAWADDFGPGLSSINLSGHTGWRGAQGADGQALFIALKRQVFGDWHTKRNAARSAGNDPANVQLMLVDALDSTTDIVAPLNFTLRRSKSRPLLMQFRISLVSLNLPIPATNNIGDAQSALAALGLGSLGASISKIAAFIASAKNFIQNNILAPIKAFMTLAVAAFNQVVSVINAGTGLIGQVLGAAQSIAQVGMNVFHTLAAIVALPAQIMTQIMAVASEFENVFCVLKNAVNKSNIYQSYEGLFGSSNCSSTSGGSPASLYTLAGTNPFTDVVGTTAAAPIAATTQATTAMRTVNNTDPVQSPMSPAQIGSALTTINAGVTVPK
jgi:hypothetical protein